MARNYYGSDCSSEEESWLDFLREDCEVEDEDCQNSSSDNDSNINDAGPYSNEPLADDEWLKEYYKERQRIEERNKQLQDRLDGVVPIDSW